MDSFLTFSNNKKISATFKNVCRVNHCRQGLTKQQIIGFVKKQKFEYQNGKPEDNTPLQAQQEETNLEITPFTAATSETSISTGQSETPSGARNWAVMNNIAAGLRLHVSSMTWATSNNPGTLLGTPPSSSTVGPVLLPYHLIVERQTPGSGVDGDLSLYALNQFGQHYMAHGLYRCGYNVYVTINGTSFHSGSLMVVAVPKPHMLLNPSTAALPNAGRKYAIGDIYNLAQLGIFPSGRLMPRSNSQIRLSLPYAHHSAWTSTIKGEIDYAIFVLVETKLGVPSGTAPTLQVNVEVEPVHAEFCAPKRVQRMNAYLQTYTQIPALPAPASYEMRVDPGAAAIASERSGVLQRLNWRPSSPLNFLPPRVEHFQTLLSRPTVKAVLDVGSAYTAGTLVAEWDVSPINNVRSLNTTNNVKTIEGSSFLETFSRNFVQWTGTIVYTLEYTGPAVSSGRLILGFQPGAAREAKTGAYGPQLPTGNILGALSTGPHVIWDLSNSTSISLPCHFAVDSPWGNVRPLQTTVSNSTTDNGNVVTGSSSGSCYLAMLTPIVTPSTTQTTFQILVHESAGPDFNLKHFAPRDTNTYPIYNGVLDQQPVFEPEIMGSDPLDEGLLSVEKVLRHPRHYATTNVSSQNVTTMPLTLITYSTGTGTGANTARISAARLFPSLFTQIRADLRIIVTTSSTANLFVAYRAPGVPDSSYGEIPKSITALTMAGFTALSTRADNIGFELFVPFPSFQSAFQTSNSMTVRSDVVYEPEQDQVDPGSLGTLIFVSRDQQSTPASVSVFLALENVSAHIPRPFGPLTSQIVQPTALDMGARLPNPESFSWEEVPEDEEMPELETAMEYQMPTLCEVTGKDQFDCPCTECGAYVVSMVRCFESGLELDDGGFVKKELMKRGLLILHPDQKEETFDTVESLYPMTVEKAEKLGWNMEQLMEDQPSWEIDSLLDEIYWTERALLEEAEENLEDFEALPLELPEGPEIPGTWVEGEFYREFTQKEMSSPFPGWHENPYSRAILNHDPSKMMRFYHYLWNDTRYAAYLILQGKNLEAITFVREHPMRKMLLPMKLAAEFVKVANLAEQRRSEMILEKDLAEVRARAFTSPIKASELMRAALRRVSYRRLTSWEQEEVKKTTRFLCSLDSSDSEDTDFFEDDEPETASYEAPLGNLPAPPSNVRVRVNTQQVAQVAAVAGVNTDCQGSEEVDDEPPSRPYIYKVNRGCYVHWGLAYKDQAISLEQCGMGARVNLTNNDLKKAQKWKEVGMYEWFRAVCMLGQEFEDYNVQNNCTHFVEVITGEKLSNTGTWLMLGLGAAAVATALIFQAPSVPRKNFVAMEQEVLDWQEPEPEPVWPKKTTRWARLLKRIPKVRTHRFRRCMFFGKRFSLPRKNPELYQYEAPINISLSNPRVERDAEASAHALRQTLQTYNEMAPQISAAVTQAAAALQDTSMKAGEFVEKLENLVSSTTDFLPKMAKTTSETATSLFSDCSRKIGSMILKIIGYTLIIFGNPNPATVAGVISLMAAEAMDSRFLRERIKSLAVSLSHKLQSLFTSCFGLNVCADDPEIFEDIPFNKNWSEYMRERVGYEAPEPSATQSFNQTVLAMKNAEWIINKIKELIEFTINKLKGKQSRDPAGFLASRADYMVKLYDDSVESGSCQNVDESLLKKRMEETSEMLSYCVNHRLGQAASLLSKTLSNYRTTQRKLASAAYHDRPEPLVVYVHGGPGCGKSVLSNLIASAYCKRMGLPFSSSVFTTPPGSEFFDGYTGQPVHIIDDFCQNTTGEDVKLFCQMVSTTRFSPPMASLEEKGVNYTSRLIIATSNLATPQSNEVRIPAALERRCHIRVRTTLHPAFSTLSGTLDMMAAFKELGPAKSADFKVDCPYLNGAAVSCSVRAGGDRKSENLSVYELMDVIFEELERRDGCQDLFRKVCYQAPGCGDIAVPNYFENHNIIPSICSHQDHSEDGCFRIYFRESNMVWHKDFLDKENFNSFLEGYWKDAGLPETGEIRPCPCLDPTCGKLLFFAPGGKSAKTHDFRSKSVMDYFLYLYGGRYVLMDPQPVEFKPVARPEKEETVEELKKSLTKLQKASLISFAITALGTLASLVGAVIWLVRRNRQSNIQHPEAPYVGMPGGSRPRREHPRPIPTRNITYEGPNTLPQIYPKIEKNTFSISFLRDGKFQFSLSGLGVAGRVALGNYHGFCRADQVSIMGKTYAVDDLKPTRIVRNGHPTDLCVFTLPDGNEFKNITRFFLSVKDRIPRADCVLISRAEKMVCNFWCRNVAGKRTVVVDARDTHEEDTHHNVIVYDVPSMPGMCGAPLLSTNSAREVVLGIHFAGSGSTGMSVPVYLEDFKSFLEADLKPIPHPGKPTHVARKSDLKKSPVHGVFPVTHGPAALTNNDRRLEPGVDLDKVMFSKHGPNHPGWDTLEPAMAYVVKDLMHKLGFHPSQPIQMWTMEQAINGEGIMDGLMMNQSPGYPYNTMGRSRRSFFVWEDNQWKPTDELRKEVERALEHPEDFYFSTFLKDEIRPLSKVTAGKTRLVDGDSLPRAIAYRMVFGALFERMLAKHGPEIHSAVGCNPETFWTELFHKMGPANFPYVFDLDYSCFDSSEPAIAFRLMGKYLQPYFGYDVTKFFEALAVSKHIYEGNAFEMEGGMPSGCVGTSMFNCINNSAFIVSALLALKLNPEEMMWICYGDDVIIATHEKNLSKRIAEFYHKHTPLVVTPASKSGDFPETSTIYEVTFLKRYFQPDSNYPELIHPYMPLDHLKQSVMWCTDGPFQAKLDSLCFLAFHAGGQQYRDFVSAIDAKAVEKGLHFNFKPFEFLMAQWYANFM